MGKANGKVPKGSARGKSRYGRSCQPSFTPSVFTLITHPQCTQFAQRQGLPRTIRDGNEQFKKPVNKRNRPLKLTNQGAIESHKIR